MQYIIHILYKTEAANLCNNTLLPSREVHTPFTCLCYKLSMNILFYLTPKCDCVCVQEDDTIRQALEKMEHASLTSVPLLGSDGSYQGTLSEGDLLWGIKNRFGLSLDLKEAERHQITEFPRVRDYSCISVRADMEDVIRLAASQNFVPVQDDDGKFIGIITRTDVFRYLVPKKH